MGLQRLRLKLGKSVNDDSITPGGPFSRSIKEVIMRGKMIDKDEIQHLQDALWDVALARIKDVYWQWSRLPEKGCPSFANLWATSRVGTHAQLGRYCDAPWA